MNEACAVVACDIPDVDIAFLRSLAQAAQNYEIAVPVGPSGLYEPLFAVYRKSIVPEIEALLGSGERSILPLYETCRTAIVRFEDTGRIRNLNTRADYESYLSSIPRRAAGRSRGRGGRRGIDPFQGRDLKRSVPGPGGEAIEEKATRDLTRQDQGEREDNRSPEPVPPSTIESSPAIAKIENDEAAGQ